MAVASNPVTTTSASTSFSAKTPTTISGQSTISAERFQQQQQQQPEYCDEGYIEEEEEDDDNHNTLTEQKDFMNDTLGPSLDMEVVLEGLQLLKEFASLDSLSIQSNRSPFLFPVITSSSPSSPVSPPTLEEEKCRQVMSRWEHFQQHARQNHETKKSHVDHSGFSATSETVNKASFCAVWSAVQRLHAALALFQEHEAQQVMELEELRRTLRQTKRRQTKLAQHCQSLTEQNQELQQQLRAKKSLLKQAKEFFRSSHAQQQSLQEENTVYKLQAHEQFLQQQQHPQQWPMSSSGRIRLESSDSNFSDADALLFPERSDHHSHPPTSTTATTTIPENTYPPSISTTEFHQGTGAKPGKGIEEDCVSLQSSASSLLTEAECVFSSVVKLEPYDDTTITSNSSDASLGSDPSSLLSYNNNDHQDPSLQKGRGGSLNHPASLLIPKPYTLQFPCSRTPTTKHQSKALPSAAGLKFQCISLQDLPLPPKGVLTAELLQDHADGEGRRNPRMEKTDEAPVGDSSKGRRGRAFIVSGYETVENNNENDPDTKNHKESTSIFPRPTLGARVLEINGQTVDPEWSLRKFMDVLQTASTIPVVEDGKKERTLEQIDTKESDPTEARGGMEPASDEEGNLETAALGIPKAQTFSITFRNDALTKRQRDRLASPLSPSSNQKDQSQIRENPVSSEQDAPQQQQPQSSTGESTNAVKPRSFGLGFLRMGSGGAGDPTLTANRPKTASSDKNDDDQTLQVEDIPSSLAMEKQPTKKNDRLGFLGLGGSSSSRNVRKEKQDEIKSDQESTITFIEDSGNDPKEEKDRLGSLRLPGAGSSEKSVTRSSDNHVTKESIDQQASTKKETSKKDATLTDHPKKDDLFGFLRFGGAEKGNSNNHQEKKDTPKNTSEAKDDTVVAGEKKDHNPLGFLRLGGGGGNDSTKKKEERKQSLRDHETDPSVGVNNDDKDQPTKEDSQETADPTVAAEPTTKNETPKGRNPLFFWDRSGD